jgi:hypothetical protein
MPDNAHDLFEIMATTRSMRRLKPDPVPAGLIRKILGRIDGLLSQRVAQMQ